LPYDVPSLFELLHQLLEHLQSMPIFGVISSTLTLSLAIPCKSALLRLAKPVKDLIFHTAMLFPWILKHFEIQLHCKAGCSTEFQFLK
jgi:hypothetical protein